MAAAPWRGSLPARPAIWIALSRRPRKLTLHDFLPDEQLREVENLHAFTGMLVFDKWTCNTNGRQTVFFFQAHMKRRTKQRRATKHG